jgi:hypothetical protein
MAVEFISVSIGHCELPLAFGPAFANGTFRDTNKYL